MPDSVAFVIHRDRKEARLRGEEMASWFRKAGVRVAYPQEGDDPGKCRMVVTFGGDGTLLAGAGYALRAGCPLMGINLGTTGFLTEGDPDQMESMFRAIMERDYTLEERGLLRVRVNGGQESCLALNDAVVTRGGFARLIQVETLINLEHWGTFIADGVIAATPTGSTGYSLSAGGPVVAPGVSCMVITPVCAHSLQHSPCVVPGEAEVEFRLKTGRDHQAELQVDGRGVQTLRAGDSVQVTGAGETLKLARIRDYRFFRVLRKKLNEWGSSGEEDRP